MYRKRFIFFLVIGITLFVSLPTINVVTWLVTGFSSGQQSQTDRWRNLWSADDAEGALAYLLMNCCNWSLRPGKVQIGSDGYLFLGNDYADVLDKNTGLVRPSLNRVDSWI